MDSKNKNDFTSNILNAKIANFPVIILLLIMIINIIAMLTDTVPNNMVGAFSIMFGLGLLLNYIGDKIPIWNEYIGGGIVLTFMFASWLVYAGIMPEKTATTINDMMDKWGFLNLYVSILITGSVLSVERKLLLKSLVGYIPCILFGILVAGIFGVIAGLFFGKNVLEVLIMYVIPIMGGGTGAGAVPMSEIYASVTGQEPASFLAVAYPILTMANIIAIGCAAVLNKIGEAKPSLTGNGILMRNQKALSAEEAKDKESSIVVGLPQIASGFVLSVFMFTFATLVSKKIVPKVFGVEIHTFAWMVILVTLFNALNILPEDIKLGAKKLQSFFVKWMTPALMVGVGVAYMDLQEMIGALTFANVIIALFVVVGAVIGTGFFGRVVGFYPIESSLTAGLCMANRGGSGDIAVLGAAKRMELMPYAQISSRIGGGIMLVIASFVFALLTK